MQYVLINDKMYKKHTLLIAFLLKNAHNVCYILIQGNRKDKSSFRQLR